MGHGYRTRPIVGAITGTGERLVPVEQCHDDTAVQIDLNGGTATVEYTLDNILYDTAAQGAVNVVPQVGEAARYVNPADANWVTVTVTNGVGTVNLPIFAIRINATVGGTPNIRYTIQQG